MEAIKIKFIPRKPTERQIEYLRSLCKSCFGEDWQVRLSEELIGMYNKCSVDELTFNEVSESISYFKDKSESISIRGRRISVDLCGDIVDGFSEPPDTQENYVYEENFWLDVIDPFE